MSCLFNFIPHKCSSKLYLYFIHLFTYCSTGDWIQGHSISDLHLQPYFLSFILKQGLTKLLRLALNLWSFYLSLLSTEIIGMHHRTWHIHFFLNLVFHAEEDLQVLSLGALQTYTSSTASEASLGEEQKAEPGIPSFNPPATSPWASNCNLISKNHVIIFTSQSCWED